MKLARDKAVIAREALRPPEVHTFTHVVKACMAERNLDSMNPKTKRKWERTAFEHCKSWQTRSIEGINRNDVYRLLSPIWKSTPETGRIVRSQLEIIFNYAKGRGWMIGENPAQWKGGLEAVLNPHKQKKHHPLRCYELQ